MVGSREEIHPALSMGNDLFKAEFVVRVMLISSGKEKQQSETILRQLPTGVPHRPASLSGKILRH